MVTATRPVYRVLFPGLLLGALALIVLVALGDVAQISSHFNSFKWQYLALALGFDLVNHFLHFLKHNFHLTQSDFKGLSLGRRIKLYLSGAVLSASAQRVSESYKSVWLSQASGLPLNTADSLHLIDRISDILSIIALATAGTLAFPAFFPFFMAILLLFLAMSFSSKFEPSNLKQMKVGESWSNIKFFLQQLHKCVESNPNAFSLPSMSLSLTLSVLSWLSQGAALFSILVGLGLEPSLVLIAISCLVLAFSMLMGLISRLPGGLGVIELAMAALLTILLNFNPELAVVSTILFRLATFWIDLLFGILFWSVTTKPQEPNQKAGRIVQG